MDKDWFYSINHQKFQAWVSDVAPFNLLMNSTEAISVQVIEDMLAKLKNAKPGTIGATISPYFPNFVLWSIQLGLVVNGDYLLEAYVMLSNKLIHEMAILNESSIIPMEQRTLKIEVLKEELGIVKYVLDTKLPYPEKMPLVERHFKYEESRIRIHRNPVPENHNPGIRVAVRYGSGFDGGLLGE